MQLINRVLELIEIQKSRPLTFDELREVKDVMGVMVDTTIPSEPARLIIEPCMTLGGFIRGYPLRLQKDNHSLYILSFKNSVLPVQMHLELQYSGNEEFPEITLPNYFPREEKFKKESHYENWCDFMDYERFRGDWESHRIFREYDGCGIRDEYVSRALKLRAEKADKEYLMVKNLEERLLELNR